MRSAKIKSYMFLYDKYISKFYKRLGITLTKEEIAAAMEEVMDSLSEQDKHILVQYGIYKYVDKVAKMEERTVKWTSRKLDLALDHLLTPANICLGNPDRMFKHAGTSLTMSGLPMRTINALCKMNITTFGDLKFWLSFGPYQLYRIPGVGKAGLVWIVAEMYKLE